MTLELTAQDEAARVGDMGGGVASAMGILSAFSRAVGASRLLDISRAHIDGCLYHGKVSLDFVELLVAEDTRVAVPTTLNVGSMDLIHPEIMLVDLETASPAKRLMKAHQQLGCVPSFTCAPYQTSYRPEFGEQIAWGESNAIVFANSVIGARTNRYGDFVDLCCAITGRAPEWGLHLDENRLARAHFQLSGFPDLLEPSDSLFVGVGLIVGSLTGELVPVIEGLPLPRDEDQLKALGAAAASSGSVGLFHAVGVTPEAPTLTDATGGLAVLTKYKITPDDVTKAVRNLSGVEDGEKLAAICLGTPHFSYAEWHRLLLLLRQIFPTSGVPIYINTGRETLQRLEAENAFEGLDSINLIPVTDTCTYITAILDDLGGVVMTNSGKWARYAPGNIGVRVAFGELEDCILSAAKSCIVRSKE